MPKPTVLPHPEYAPEGASIQVPGKTTVCDALLEHGVEIEPACGKVGACTTCHVLVASGFDSLNPVNDNEEDMPTALGGCSRTRDWPAKRSWVPMTSL
jgi:2Fe-2S ferredoxin